MPKSPRSKPDISKLWFWSLPVLGICILAFCLMGGGLLFWQLRSSQVEHTGSVAATVSLSDGAMQAPVSPAPTSTVTVPLTYLADSLDQPKQLTPSYCGGDHPANTLPSAPILSPASFSTRQDGQGWPLDVSLQFTTTVTRVQASFGYTGMRNGMTWERVWFFGDQEIMRSSGVWDAGSRGALTVYAQAEQDRFVPGRYRLEIYVEDELLSSGSYLIAAEETPTRQPIRVAYTSWDGRKHRINLLDLDSSESQPLIDSAHQPAWSLEPNELIFEAENGIAEGTAGLWMYDLAQNQASQLNQETFFPSLSWSPNRIFVATSDAGEQGPRLLLWDLAQGKAYPGPFGEEPAWSPEGRRLAYRACDVDNWQISTIEVISNVFDTATIRQLTAGDDSQPAWSWDGQQLAFVRQDGENQDIYSVTANGSNLTRLTDHPAADITPVWTPDNRLLFRSLRSGRWGIYIMNADGSNQRRLITTSSPVDWQPDRLAVRPSVPPAP